MRAYCFCEYELTAQFCVELGQAVSLAGFGGRVGVGCSGSKKSHTLRYALMAGLLASGCKIWDIGECFEAQLSFFSGACSLSLGLFIGDSSLSAYGPDGAPFNVTNENLIRQSLRSREAFCVNESNIHPTCHITNPWLLYRQELIDSAFCSLDGINVRVISDNEKIRRFFGDLLCRLGCETGDDITLCINSSGTVLTASDETMNVYTFEQLLAVCSNSFGSSLSESGARGTVWLNDGLFAGIRVLCSVKKAGKTLKQLIEELPPKGDVCKIIPFRSNGRHLADFFENARDTGNGVIFENEKGSVTLLPCNAGEGVILRAVCANAEIAHELCADVEDILKNELT